MKYKFILLFILCFCTCLAVLIICHFSLMHDNSLTNTYLSLFLDDEITHEMPTKDSGYILKEESHCNNGVTIQFDLLNWDFRFDFSNYKLENKNRTNCNFYFRKALFSDYITACGNQGYSAVSCMKQYANKDALNLAYDNTSDNNLRFIGNNPDNYVNFNNELWRIIGVMENIDNGKGKKELRLKLVRNESLGNYAWDSSSYNSGNGVNEWSTSTIQNMLNDTYYSSLSESAQQFMDVAKWHTGSNGYSDFSLNTNGLISHFYSYERSNNIGKVNCLSGNLCTDPITRTTSWIGKVGLIYPSDYGYAIGGAFRTVCLNTVFLNLGNNDACKNNSWLNKGELWTMMPRAGQNVASYVFSLLNGGLYANGSASFPYAIYPVIYLKSEVKIVSGKGTRANPYELAI